MTVEKTVVAKFEGEDTTIELELKPNGEIVVREYDSGQYYAGTTFIGGMTLSQLEQAVALFKKERAHE